LASSLDEEARSSLRRRNLAPPSLADEYAGAEEAPEDDAMSESLAYQQSAPLLEEGSYYVDGSVVKHKDGVPYGGYTNSFGPAFDVEKFSESETYECIRDAFTTCCENSVVYELYANKAEFQGYVGAADLFEVLSKGKRLANHSVLTGLSGAKTCSNHVRIGLVVFCGGFGHRKVSQISE
jgi:hypothetical protein